MTGEQAQSACLVLPIAADVGSFRLRRQIRLRLLHDQVVDDSPDSFDLGRVEAAAARSSSLANDYRSASQHRCRPALRRPGWRFCRHAAVCLEPRRRSAHHRGPAHGYIRQDPTTPPTTVRPRNAKHHFIHSSRKTRLYRKPEMTAGVAADWDRRELTEGSGMRNQ